MFPTEHANIPIFRNVMSALGRSNRLHILLYNLSIYYDMQKKSIVRMPHEVDKTIQFEKLLCW
jgi:hypothetical protein